MSQRVWKRHHSHHATQNSETDITVVQKVGHEDVRTTQIYAVMSVNPAACRRRKAARSMRHERQALPDRIASDHDALRVECVRNCRPDSTRTSRAFVQSIVNAAASQLVRFLRCDVLVCFSETPTLTVP